MKAVMYGAGNIGRGYIGLLLSQSGYEVSFVDVNDTVIAAMNDAHRYPVDILLESGTKEEWAENISCVDGKNPEAVAEAIAKADVMATAVGVNILKFIAAPIIRRFANRGLGDTVKRVGGDIRRKLSKGDCLVGALNMCRAEGVDSLYIEAAIAAALCFSHDDVLKEKSAEEILKEFSELSDTARILGIYKKLKNGVSLEALLLDLKQEAQR